MSGGPSSHDLREALTSAATCLTQEDKDFTTDSMARYFEKVSSEYVPKTFQDLVNPGETYLVEVACSPQSRLSEEVQKRAGYEAAAIRCSHWNGCDLGESKGVKHVLDVIKTASVDPFPLFKLSVNDLRSRRKNCRKSDA